MSDDEAGRFERTIDGHLQSSLLKDCGSPEPISEDTLRELGQSLLALARGDLTAREEPSSGLTGAVNTAARALAERLRPVRTDAGRLKEAAEACLESVRSWIDMRGHTEATHIRLTELSHLAERLAEIGGQAQVAALNVAIEVTRDRAASQDTMNAFADEVRRFAERIESVAMRLSEVVMVVRSEGSFKGELEPESVEKQILQGLQQLDRGTHKLLMQLDEQFTLPHIDERDPHWSRRIADLREELDTKLGRLLAVDEASPELENAIEELEGLLSGPLDLRRSEMDQGEDSSS